LYLDPVLSKTVRESGGFRPDTAVPLFSGTLGGVLSGSSSSVAGDLRRDILPLTDSHITARHVTQDKRRWWPLLKGFLVCRRMWKRSTISRVTYKNVIRYNN